MSIKFFTSLAPSSWTRREWLTTNAAALMATQAKAAGWVARPFPTSATIRHARDESAAQLVDRASWEALAQRGVDAAKAAGASYADVRLTRIVQQLYRFAGQPGNYLGGDIEVNGVGIRVLVNGYWGFSAAPRADAATIDRLARDAVAQAKVNALGTTRVATLAAAPAVRGEWSTPMRIDPFTIPIEEKNDYIQSWMDFSFRVGAPIDPTSSWIGFARQERVVGTSDGSLFTQRLYESGGAIVSVSMSPPARVSLTGLESAGKGWELILDANIMDQLAGLPERMKAEMTLGAGARPAVVGRYTVVCDGAAMAALLEQTLGLSTQLDRALGYEANASGTSYIDDPLAMLGSFQVGSPLVNVTADRSMPGGLATVKWDDEGVIPRTATLVKDGILNDFQTTREQASWIAPFYEREKRPVQSNGYAAAETALATTLQHAPNFALAPSASAVKLDDLIANVATGVLLTGAEVVTDFQVRTGLAAGGLRKITNGRLGPRLSGGAIVFNTQELWRQVVGVGDEHTVAKKVSSQYPFGSLISMYGYTPNIKGQPPQLTGHTVTAPAATITGLAIVDPTRKA